MKAWELLELVADNMVTWWGTGYTKVDNEVKRVLYLGAHSVWVESLLTKGASEDAARWTAVRYMFRKYRAQLAHPDLKQSILRFIARRRRLDYDTSFDDLILGVLVFRFAGSARTTLVVSRVCNELGLPNFDERRSREALYVARVLTRLARRY